jgi:2-succinyl-6-hydroxy-2,4-cyclohexadiene-1-carboxylate synthase
MRHDAVAPRDRWVFAHGFTQTSRSWTAFLPLLRERLPDIETLAVDLPGHGDAPPPADADLHTSAERMVAEAGRAVYVGYSMGGRVALHAALEHPVEVRALVLIGATAGIDDDGERSERRAADERLARRIETIGVPAFLTEWLGNPMFAGLSDGAAMRDDRLRNTAIGMAASLRATGTGTQQPLWDRLGDISVPVLVVAGEHDRKFRALGERIADAVPDSTLSVIDGAGHSVHLERPEATADAIAEWYRLRAPARW